MTALSIAVLVLAGGLTGQAPPASAGWQSLSIENGAMRIRFPGVPERNSAPLANPEGAIQHTSYFFISGGTYYGVQHFRYPHAFPDAQVPARLDAEKKVWLQRQGQGLIDQKNLEIDGIQGGEFRAKGPSPLGEGMVIRWTRYFFKGVNQYTITVMSPPDQPLPDEAERFMESIHFKQAEPKLTVGDQPSMKRHPAPRGRPGNRARLRGRARTGAGERDAEGPLPAADTPEAALRSFMIALIANDEPALKALTLPVPESYLAELLKNVALPADQFKEARTFFWTMKIRTLQPGDRVELEGGRTMTIRPTEVTETDAVLMPEGAPLPTRLQKVQGRWRVDARPFTAGRKPAEEASKKKDKGR